MEQSSWEARAKHLEMIQSVIARMAANAFLIKGWTITFFSAILLLGIQQRNWKFLLLALFTTIWFMFLDIFYHKKERCFRLLYQSIEQNTDSQEPPRFQIDASGFRNNQKCSWISVATSWSIAGLYVPLIATAAVTCGFYVNAA